MRGGVQGSWNFDDGGQGGWGAQVFGSIAFSQPSRIHLTTTPPNLLIIHIHTPLSCKGTTSGALIFRVVGGHN